VLYRIFEIQPWIDSCRNSSHVKSSLSNDKRPKGLWHAAYTW